MYIHYIYNLFIWCCNIKNVVENRIKLKYITMGKFYKILLLSCFFVVSSLSSYAQTIGFIRFNNSANYTPGSGVSVIINPTGVFELNNQFVLELSNPGGAFTSPIVLITLDEFYGNTSK